MTTFDEREKAFEKKFEHDQDLQFKATARKNKLLGLWAASLMGKSGADAEAYAKEVVMADLDVPGDHDVIAKLVKDLAAAGKPKCADHEGDALGVFCETERSLAALGMTGCCVANVPCHPERREGPLRFPFQPR